MVQSFVKKKIEYSFILPASPKKVYDAWTTADGIKSFFAPECTIEMKKFGKYHIIFDPDAPVGSKGAEDEAVLGYEPNKMFSFTWGFPPTLPELRANQKTVVLLRFSREGEETTKFSFSQTGWGSGEPWKEGFQYFVHAWGNIVLPRLRYRFEVGPIDWEKMPDISQYGLTD